MVEAVHKAFFTEALDKMAATTLAAQNVPSGDMGTGELPSSSTSPPATRAPLTTSSTSAMSGDLEYEQFFESPKGHRPKTCSPGL
eukprot:4907362-Heterocapsa_arctica.AAC.1